MKKANIMLGAFLCLSLSAFAAVDLNSGEVQQKNGVFTTKDGKLLEGEYKVKSKEAKSTFLFQKGKIEKFSYNSEEEDELEMDGKFVDNQQYFKGEVSVQTFVKNLPEEKEKLELSLDGSMEAKEISQFASDILSKGASEVKKPTFDAIRVWKLQNGERETERELTKKVDKKESSEKVLFLEVEKTAEKQIFSDGKLVNSSQATEKKIEKKIKTQ